MQMSARPFAGAPLPGGAWWDRKSWQFSLLPFWVIIVPYN